MNREEAGVLVCEYGRKLLNQGLVIGTWGNLSIRTDDGFMVITSSGADYETLTPKDLAVINLKTGEQEGGKPSSEKPLHWAVYMDRPNAGAVIHTHSPNASTLAAARRDLPPILDDLAQIAGPGVRIAEYALPSTKKIVRVTIKALKGRNAVILANHGAVCVGRNMAEAFLCCEVLEKACRSYIEAEFLGGAKGISKFEAALMHEIYIRKYSKQKNRNK